MRKGYTLVEMLLVIVTIPAVAFALNGLFKTLIRDIPRSSQVVQENTTVLNMLEQMQQDLDKAKELPKTFAEHTADDNLLLIESDAGTICYQKEHGKVLRYTLTKGQPTRRSENGPRVTDDEVDGARIWTVPNANIEWRIWRQGETGYAVEVKTHIRHKLRKKFQKKMANSHLYFAGLKQ